MSLLTELFAFMVVGDARYGRDETPLDKMNKQAEKGFKFLETMEKKNGPKRIKKIN